MTEADILQVAQETWSNVISILTLFITITSAYLVAAYTVGKNLTKQQFSIVNVLYGAFAGWGIYGAYKFSSGAAEAGRLALEMSTQRAVGPSGWEPFMFLSIMILINAATYKFMWDIRHPETDRSDR